MGNMSRNRFIFSAILIITISFLYGGPTKEALAQTDTTICKGVSIDQVDVSQMTGDQARTAIAEYIESLRNKRIAVMVGNDIVQTTLGSFGYNADYSDAVSEALSFGKSGNLIKRYKELKDIEQGSVVLPLTYTFDTQKVMDWVGTNVSAYNIIPVNATIRRENGVFKYTDEIIGSKVNVDHTTQIVSDAINNWIRQDIIVEATMEDDMPLYTRADVERCNTVLGAFTTDYASSAQGRAANLANGARLINNMVLYPGEVFSAYEVLTPFTEKNGYYVAGAYLNGQVVDSVGGGACQVTTTLYNTVLAAELEVVERMPHSMTISYVDLARDAAIAGTYKDLKFKNNTDAPIVIEAIAHNRKITFKIWGHETRDTVNRRVEYETKVLSKTLPPTDKITEDPTKPKTYRKVTQSAHTGYKAQLYKVVYENGVEVSRTLVNTSTYKAEPQYVTIGTKEVEEETPKVPATNTNNNDNNKKDSQKKDKTSDTNSTNSNNQASFDDEPLEWDPSWDPVE